MAEKLGLARSCIVEIEQGKRNVCLLNLQVIADGFEMSISEAFLQDLKKARPLVSHCPRSSELGRDTNHFLSAAGLISSIRKVFIFPGALGELTRALGGST